MKFSRGCESSWWQRDRAVLDQGLWLSDLQVYFLTAIWNTHMLDRSDCEC